MDTLYHLIEQYGLILVFINVLVEQLGAPVPAYPTLIITGALSATGRYSPALLLLLAVSAALLPTTLVSRRAPLRAPDHVAAVPYFALARLLCAPD
jgi:membrane protein DedA with SNARE-associated domain